MKSSNLSLTELKHQLVSVIPAPLILVSSPGNAALRELPVAANGMSGVQSAVGGATSVPGKRRLEERSAFDKRLRFSVRQTESAYRYRDIVVKKQDGFTHILLSTKSSENNTLNPEVSPRPHHAILSDLTIFSRHLGNR